MCDKFCLCLTTFYEKFREKVSNVIDLITTKLLEKGFDRFIIPFVQAVNTQENNSQIIAFQFYAIFHDTLKDEGNDVKELMNSLMKEICEKLCKEYNLEVPDKKPTVIGSIDYMKFSQDVHRKYTGPVSGLEYLDSYWLNCVSEIPKEVREVPKQMQAVHHNCNGKKHKGALKDKTVFYCKKCEKKLVRKIGNENNICCPGCKITKPYNNKVETKSDTKIPQAVKNALFHKYMLPNGRCKCDVCGAELYQNTMQCGHIISRKNGGSVLLTNMLPICGSCNASIGSQNMTEFKSRYGINDGTESTNVADLIDYFPKVKLE